MTHMAKHIFTLLYSLPVYECLHRDLYSPTHTYKKKKNDWKAISLRAQNSQ